MTNKTEQEKINEAFNHWLKNVWGIEEQKSDYYVFSGGYKAGCASLDAKIDGEAVAEVITEAIYDDESIKYIAFISSDKLLSVGTKLHPLAPTTALNALIAKAKAEENERCAKIGEAWGGHVIASYIRNVGKKPSEPEESES